MSDSGFPLDLKLWLDQDIIQRQNWLKSAFLILFEKVGNSFPDEILREIDSNSKGKKISKGNDLLGFPYLVLDLIRNFKPENAKNIRILNWFGHGMYLIYYQGQLIPAISQKLIEEGFSFALTESPWDYPEMILKRSTSDDLSKRSEIKSNPTVWLKEISIQENLENSLEMLQNSLKNLIEILKLSELEKRN